jgi:PKD repeat protein
VHAYAAEGTYTVTLIAARGNETDEISLQVVISDPNQELTALAGNDTKTWKLLRAVTETRWPLEVGPFDRSAVWWAQGRQNDELANRPCILNDEWTFDRVGGFVYNSNGDFWAEGGLFEPANLCQATVPANMKGPNGEDQSAWGDATHAYTMAGGKLTLTGFGAFIGLPKIGTDQENLTPAQSVTLDIEKLYDGTTDTLVLVSNWKFPGNTSGLDDAYWRIVLVHYDNPSEEPPVAGFSVEQDGKTVTCTNNSFDATSYNWDFGDGMSSGEANPVHTYANAGIYTIRLTATRGTATSVATREVTISGEMTAADLVGPAWRIRNAANSIFVGPGFGNSDWWKVPPEYLDGSSTGVDDWSCITDDEFIFSNDGTYQYNTNGDARNDGYFGSPNGCWSDAEVAASGNGAAFGSGTHLWSFTPASQSPSGRPIIQVMNGASGAAFLGFYKGYYGGENTNGANPPNGGLPGSQYEVVSYVNDGTTETLMISVDYTADHSGTQAWTMVLVR